MFILSLLLLRFDHTHACAPWVWYTHMTDVIYGYDSQILVYIVTHTPLFVYIQHVHKVAKWDKDELQIFTRAIYLLWYQSRIRKISSEGKANFTGKKKSNTYGACEKIPRNKKKELWRGFPHDFFRKEYDAMMRSNIQLAIRNPSLSVYLAFNVSTWLAPKKFMYTCKACMHDLCRLNLYSWTKSVHL